MADTDIKVTQLTQETSTTIDGTEQFVAFDSAEGKRVTFNDYAKWVALNKGTIFYKDVTISSASEDTSKVGYLYKQTVPWTGMKSTDLVEGYITSGSHYAPIMIESVTDEVNLYFILKPPTNLKLRLLRSVITYSQ